MVKETTDIQEMQVKGRIPCGEPARHDFVEERVALVDAP
jgi:hypothetical protein